MATVPYKAAPSVEPASRPPDDYFHLEASPERFAAAAHGLQQLGQSVSGVAELWGQIQTDSQLNNAMKESNDAVNEFEKLRGQDALDAQEGLKQRLDQIHDHYSGQLGPEQKLKFDNSYRNYQYRYLNGKIDTHANSQGHAFATQTNKDTEALANDTAAKNYNNPDVVETQRHIARDAAVKQLQVDGMAGEKVNVDEAVRRADTGVYKAVSEAMYVHDPEGAMKYVEDHRKELGAAYAPLADQFRARAENVRIENQSNVMQRILGTADPVVKKGIADANRAVLGEEKYKAMYPDEGAPKSNVVPLKPPAELPTDQAKRLLEEEKAKGTQAPGAAIPPKPGAQPAKDELGRVGGQGASFQVPFNPLMATAEGRAQLIENGLKTYAPGTTLTSTFGKFTIPPAGSTFQYEGKSYTVPMVKPPAAAPAKAAEPAPAAKPTAAATPEKQSQNFSPVQEFGPGKVTNAAYHAIEEAAPTNVNAHTDRNLFSSGAARRKGISGGVGQNLTSIDDGQGHTLHVNESAAPHFAGFLKELTSMGYKINDIGGYDPRMKRGSFTSMSEHAFGNAIDINPDKNPFHSSQTNLPANVAQIAAKYGLIWGGDWDGRSKDPMHFEWSGKNTQVAGQ